MNIVATICFILALTGGTAVIAGVLWALFAHSLWGHPAGPPPGLSPEEVRAWYAEHEHNPQHPPMSWEDIRQALREHRWTEVWPVLLILAGMTLVLIFLPLGVLIGTDAWMSGLLGLIVGGVFLWRVQHVLRK